jgi:hypothetical protein
MVTDPACEDLAELSIDGRRGWLIWKGYTTAQLDVLRGRLAERIQEAIDDWFAQLNAEIDAKGAPKGEGHGDREDHH